MGMAVWIIFCLFASIGLVQCGFWLFEALRIPQDARLGCHVIPLFDCPEELEVRVRLAMTRIRRAGAEGEPVLLLDMGLGEECRLICENLLREIGGAYICGIDDLSDTVRGLYNLQFSGNVVE